MKYRCMKYPLNVMAVSIVLAIGIFIFASIAANFDENLGHLGWVGVAILVYMIFTVPASFVIGLVVDLVKGPKEKK